MSQKTCHYSMHKKIFRYAVTKPPFVLVFLITFRSLSWADTAVPKNVEQVTSSIQDSILQVWTEFVGRIPYWMTHR